MSFCNFLKTIFGVSSLNNNSSNEKYCHKHEQNTTSSNEKHLDFISDHNNKTIEEKTVAVTQVNKDPKRNSILNSPDDITNDIIDRRIY